MLKRLRRYSHIEFKVQTYMGMINGHHYPDDFFNHFCWIIQYEYINIYIDSNFVESLFPVMQIRMWREAVTYLVWGCVTIPKAFIFLILDTILEDLSPYDKSALVQVMVWHWTGDKPLSEPRLIYDNSKMRAALKLSRWIGVVIIEWRKYCVLANAIVRCENALPRLSVIP